MATVGELVGECLSGTACPHIYDDIGSALRSLGIWNAEVLEMRERACKGGEAQRRDGSTKPALHFLFPDDCRKLGPRDRRVRIIVLPCSKKEGE